jgi:hypothetical protein
VATYGKLPLQFETNSGQTDKQVKFLSRGRGYTLFLTDKAEAVLCLNSPQRHREHGERQRNISADKTSVLRMKLVGANPNPKVSGGDELPGKVNYFLGNHPKKWRTDVSTYEKVRYNDVYPGVDLVYYGNQEGRLEHDFIVAPGADPKQIAISIRGLENAPCSRDFNRFHHSSATRVRANEFATTGGCAEIDNDGDLVLHTDGGDVEFHKPVAYQDTPDGRKEVESRYALLPQSAIINPKWRRTITVEVKRC